MAMGNHRVGKSRVHSEKVFKKELALRGEGLNHTPIAKRLKEDVTPHTIGQ